MGALDKYRKRFEEFIAAAPFERDIRRHGNDEQEHAWPGQYVDYSVELAWAMVQLMAPPAMQKKFVAEVRNPVSDAQLSLDL